MTYGNDTDMGRAGVRPSILFGGGDVTKTVNDVYIALFRRFREADLPQPALAAREITALVCGSDKDKISQWGYSYVDGETEEKANLLCERCLKGEPLAYLIGEWDFYGLTFKVNPSVLIPRPDTEVLCQLAIEAARVKKNARVLDLCCGSGCIGIALAHEVKDAKVLGADISDEALQLARENARHNGVQERYLAFRADVRLPAAANFGQFDLIVSNPPYISAAEMASLDRSVRCYEPRLALYGGEDGLDFYRAICSGWRERLTKGGIILFECGYRQAESVLSILEKNGFHDAGITEDMTGIQRVVYARAGHDK